MDETNESPGFSMIHRPGFRLACVLIGAGLVLLGACGAVNKVSDEGWDGPSSQPGAATHRSR